jgi:hypothetical protein
VSATRIVDPQEDDIPRDSISSPTVAVGKGQCRAPGCMLQEWHLGTCGGPLGKRVSVRPVAPAQPLTVKCLPTFDSPVKTSQRALLGEIAKREEVAFLPIAFLDDEHGSCSRYFLELGIDPSRLVPVNRKPIATLDLAGVTPITEDIFDVARRARPNEYALVWYDLTVKANALPDLLDVVHASKYVMICVSTRGQVPKDAMRHLELQCQSLFCVNIIAAYPYCGVRTDGSASTRTNMVCIFFQHDATRVPARLRATTMQAMKDYHSWIHKPLLVPLARWEKANVKIDRRKYRVKGRCIVAVVVDVHLGELRLFYELSNGSMQPDTREMEKRVAQVSGKITPQLASTWAW